MNRVLTKIGEWFFHLRGGFLAFNTFFPTRLRTCHGEAVESQAQIWSGKRCGKGNPKIYQCSVDPKKCTLTNETNRVFKSYVFGPPGWSGEGGQSSDPLNFVGVRRDILRNLERRLKLKAADATLNAVNEEPTVAHEMAHEMAHERWQFCPRKVPRNGRMESEREAEREAWEVCETDGRKFMAFQLKCSGQARVVVASMIGPTPSLTILKFSPILVLTLAAMLHIAPMPLASWLTFDVIRFSKPIALGLLLVLLPQFVIGIRRSIDDVLECAS